MISPYSPDIYTVRPYNTYVMTKAIFNFNTIKIQKVRTSLYACLPHMWVTNTKLKKGDILKIELYDDQSIRMTPVSRNHHEPQNPGADTIELIEEMSQQ
jgi:antitoxin component of MazEF toxin-antitoxin module